MDKQINHLTRVNDITKLMRLIKDSQPANYVPNNGKFKQITL